MAPVEDRNGWTGGQWSLVRGVFAVGLVVVLALSRFPYGWALLLLLLVAVVLARRGHAMESAIVLLILGSFAFLVWLMIPVIEERAPAPSATASRVLYPSYVAFALLVTTVYCFAGARPAPGQSLARRVYLLASMSWVAYVVSLLIALSVVAGFWSPSTWWGDQRADVVELLGDRRPFDLRFTAPPTLLVPLWWFLRPVRPFLWAATATLLVVVSVSLGWWMVLVVGAMFAVLAFDPGWIRAQHAGTTDVLFYDGACGLCHASVRLVLGEDRTGTAFRFAPIGGAAWRETFPDEGAAPANTLVVRTARGETLARSAGALYIARRLGGLWRLLGTLGIAVPRPLRDAIYRFVARVRHHLFPAPEGACPLVHADLRARFDLRP